MTDGELVRQVLRGQTSAREELARIWSSRVLAMCRARVGRIAGEDVAQESLGRAFQQLPQLADPDCFGGWIRSIAIRACLDWHRHRRHRHSVDGDVAVEQLAANSPDGGLEQSEERRSLWEAIEKLPEDQKEVLLLHYCDDLSYDAIAQWLDVSRSTVNSRLARARDSVRRSMLRKESERDRGLFSRT